MRVSGSSHAPRRASRAERAQPAAARRTRQPASARRPATSRRGDALVEQTRALILSAAELEFAKRGYAAARLEDIGERVGITRAAVVYHYADKARLYTAVLEAAFGPLARAIDGALAGDLPYAARVDRLVDVWLDLAERRPTVARLFMREVADSDRRLRPELAALVDPMFARVTAGIAAGREAGVVRAVDPAHLVSILAGAMVWFVTHAPLLGGGAPPRGAARVATFTAFREELRSVTHHLLGLPARRVTAPLGAARVDRSTRPSDPARIPTAPPSSGRRSRSSRS